LGNCGCNDYDLENTDENFELLKSAIRWNCSNPAEAEDLIEEEEKCRSKDPNNPIRTQDFFILEYLIHIIKDTLQPEDEEGLTDKGFSAEQVARYMESLSECDGFVEQKPNFFFECESAVFEKGGDNSLFYTTSKGRAQLFALILNDWLRLRKKEREE